MKLLSFSLPTPSGPVARTGALAGGDQVVDLEAAFRLKLQEEGLTRDGALRLSSALTPPDMTALIQGAQHSLSASREALDWAEAQDSSEREGVTFRFPLEGLHYLPAVPRPPLVRDFMAFETHLKNIFPKLGREIPPEWYNFPVYYKANPHSIGAHLEDIPMPDYAKELDFEFEFGIVIGKEGINIPKESAREHIFGLTLYNDFSAREIQSREMSVGLGPAKGKDFGHAHVFGPWIVTMDEIEDLYNLPMICRVNDKPWSESNSGTIHWKIEELIAHGSWNERIFPGEIFGSGTVGNGSGAERGVFLNRGDVVELEMGPLGILRNKVV